MNPDTVNEMNDKSTMNKIMEYMAFGKPLVSFDLKEARVSAGEAAVFVPAGDVRAFAEAMVELLDDDGRREQMGSVGRRRVLTQLAWDHQTENLTRAYTQAVP